MSNGIILLTFHHSAGNVSRL
jgi:hypothetical protein